MAVTINGITGIDLPAPLSVADGGTGVSTVTGLVKGNGTSAMSAAVAGTDYVTPNGTETLSNKTLAASNLGTPSSGDLSNCTADGTVAVGYRNVPWSGGANKSSSYVLSTGDVGKFVSVGTGGSITIPASTFSAGDIITIYNSTTGNITITCSGLDTFIAGINTVKTSLTLATRGLATVFFYSPTTCVITGNVS